MKVVGGLRQTKTTLQHKNSIENFLSLDTEFHFVPNVAHTTIVTKNVIFYFTINKVYTTETLQMWTPSAALPFYFFGSHLVCIAAALNPCVSGV